MADRGSGQATGGRASRAPQTSGSGHMQPRSPEESPVRWDQQAQQAQYSQHAQQAEHAQHAQQAQRAMQPPASAPPLRFLSRGSADAQLLRPAKPSPLQSGQGNFGVKGLKQGHQEAQAHAYCSVHLPHDWGRSCHRHLPQSFLAGNTEH